MKKLLILLISTLVSATIMAQTPSGCFSTGNDISFNKAYGATRGIVRGDFNNDGHLDVVVGHNGNNSLNSYSFLPGLGDGRFGTPISGNSAKLSNELVSADFNQDGNLDLMISKNTGLTLYYGQGNGTFDSINQYLVGYAKFMDTGDVNMDGLVDVVFSTGNSFQVMIANAAPLGTFTASSVFPIAGAQADIRVMDMDGDGKLDIMTTGNNSGSLFIAFCKNTTVTPSSLTFNAGVLTYYTGGTTPVALTVCDIDNDGDQDVVNTHNGSPDMKVFFNNGSAVFPAVPTNYTIQTGAQGVENGDFNGDGNQDIVVANSVSGTLSIFFGAGGGALSLNQTTHNPGSPRCITIADFSGDGKLDIITGQFTGLYINSYLGNSSNNYVLPNIHTAVGKPNGIHANDFNNDGKKDIVYTNSSANNFALMLGNGAGVFTPSGTFTTGTFPFDIVSGDLNGDGNMDVVTADTVGNTVTVFHGNGSGGFTNLGSFAAGTRPRSVAIGNLNGDGFLDIAVTNASTNSVNVLLATGATTFAAPVSYATGTAPIDLKIAKINNDAFEDIVVANYTTNNISRLINTSGIGTFNAPLNTNCTSKPSAIDAGDFDGDGDIDVVAIGSGGLSRLYNAGGANLINATFVIPGANPAGASDIKLFDVNSDGKLDVVALFDEGKSTSGNLILFMANSAVNNSFDYSSYPLHRFATAVGPESMAIADFNNDNRIDLAVANNINEQISVHWNTTPKITAGGTTTFCNGNSVNLTSTSALYYTWSPSGATTQTNNVTSPVGVTPHYVTASSSWSEWCSSDSDTIKVTINPGPAAPTITPGGPTTICGSGSVTLTSSQTTGNQWYKDGDSIVGATNQTYIATTSGVYTVTYMSGGCTSDVSAGITVNVVVAPVITAGGPTTFCTGGSVTLTSDVSSNITWTPGGATTQSINATTSGSYFVTLSVGGCPAINSNTIVVTVNSGLSAPTITPTGPVTLCPSGTVTLTSSSATDNVWSTGATTQSIVISSAGSYYVHLDNGTCSSPNSNTVVVNMGTTPATPTVSAGGPTTFCAGGSVTLTSSSGSTYTWTPSAPSTQSINVTSSGTYSVVVTNAAGCQSAPSSPIAVTVNPLPSTPTITAGGATTFCAGGSVTLSAPTSTSYLWTPGGATTQNINVITSGTYTCQVGDANGCLSLASNAITVTVNAAPTTPVITAGGPTTFCAGGSVTLSAPTATSYAWTPSGTTQNINVNTSGTYSVVVTNAAGCQSAPSNTITVTVNPLPSTPTITAGGPTTFCAGGSVTLSAPASTTYLWSPGGATTQNINVSTSGSYTCQIGDANGCLSLASNAITVTVNAAPTTPVITAGGPTTFCAGGSVTLSAPTATSYAWTPSGSTQNINVNTSGTYSVVVTNAAGCQSAPSNTITVTVNSLPATPTITAGGPTTFCIGGSVTLSAPTASSYIWTPSGSTQNINATTSGNYSVVVVDANGCQSAASNVIPVTVNPLPSTPTITAGGATTFCAGGSVTLSAPTSTTYLWSNGLTTQNINVTTSGSYTCQVGDVNGCLSLASNAITVTVNALPTTPVITAGGPTTFCAGGSVTLSAPTATSYAWTPSGTTQNINVTTSGTYSVVVTNAAGCQSAPSNTITVTVNPLPSTPTITAGGPITFCAGGSVTLSAPTSTSYLWSNNATTQSIVVSTSGTFTCQVGDVNGCLSLASNAIVVTVNALPTTPTITPSGPTTFCSGGSVTLSAPTSTSYLWSNSATTQNIIVTTSGTYTLQVGNAAGCMSAVSSTVTVTVNPLPSTPTITAGGPTTFCAGGSVTLTSSAGSSYLWSPGNQTTSSINVSTSGTYAVQVTNSFGCQSTFSAGTIVTVNPLPTTPTITAGGPTTFCAGGSVTLSAPTSTTYLWSNGALTQNINVTSSGTYTVQVGDVNGCMSNSSAAVTVTVNPLPSTPTITAGGPTTFCSGSSVTLTASAGSTYLWSTGATTPSINVTTSGSYTVQVTNSFGCFSATSSATTVTVNPLPTTPVITPSGPTTFCSGGSVILSSSASSTYAWSNGSTMQNIIVTTSGTYTVQVTDGNGCQSAPSSPVSVTVNPLPSTPVISAGGPTTFCAGGSVTLSAPTSTSYLWSNSATTQSIIVTTSGTFTVQVTNANGCTSAISAPVTVTVNPIPATPTITPSGPTTFCAGGSVTLTSSASAGNSWSPGGQTTPSINVTSSGTYILTVTQLGCTSASTSQTVTVNPLPTTPTITVGGPTTFCIGGSVTLTAPTSAGYLWSNGATTQSINVTTGGPVTVQVTNSNGCTSLASAPVNIIVNPLPSTPTITAGGATTFCSGGSVSLSSTSATSYLWAPGGQTTQVISATTSGNYSVQITDANGCQSAASNVISVTVNPLPPAPTITAGGATTFCLGGSVSLTSSTGSTYSWTPGGASTQSINVTASGNYSVKVTDVNGCLSPASNIITVTVNPLPTAPIITASGPTTFCTGGSVDLSCPTSSGYNWTPGGQTTQSITVTTSGTYSVQRVDANGCISPFSPAVTVTVNPIPPTPVITAGGATTFCSGGSVVLSSSSGSGNTWNPGGLTTQNITVSTSGTYTLTVTANGCTSPAASQVVTVNPLPATPTITVGGPTTFCAGGSVTLTAPTSTSYLWSTGATTQVIVVSTSGPVTVQVTDGNGCQSLASAPVNVTVNPLPTTPTITAGGATTFCLGGSVTLTSSSSTSYLWSPGGQITQSINVTASGTYSVKVTDGNGCQSLSSNSVTVTVNPLPGIPTITAGGPTTFCAGGSVTLTSSSGVGYSWTPGGATTQSIVVNTSGNYNVKITDGNGCQSVASADMTVTVVPLPSTPAITASGPTTFCAGGSVDLSCPTSSSYLWSNGATTQTITVTASGTFTVQRINASGCYSAPSAPITVTVIPIPPTPTISANGPTTFCAGGSVILTSSASSGNLWVPSNATTQSIVASNTNNYVLTVTVNGCTSAPAYQSVVVNPTPVTPNITASGPTTFCAGAYVDLAAAPPGYSYQWAHGPTTQVVSILTSGSYQVMLTDGNGCQSPYSAPMVVTVNPLPATPTITAGGPTTFCTGGSVTLTAPVSTAYLWSNGATTQNINVTTSGSYTVKVYNINGCESATSLAVNVTVNPLPPAPTITAGGSTIFCAGGSVALTSTSGNTYIWSNSGSTQTITVSSSGNYTAQITDGNGCLSPVSNAIAVTVNPLPAAPTITAGGPTTFCVGDSVLLTAPAFASYLWSTSATTQSIMVHNAGTYTVQVTDLNGCVSPSSASTVVTVNPIPAPPTITPSGPTTFCAGNSVVLTSSSSTGNTWSPGGQTTQSITASAAGTYTLTQTQLGCTSPSASITITVNPIPPAPIVTASGPTTFCAGGSVDLTSSIASSINWSTSETTQTITVNATGNYTVTQTVLGCTSLPSSPVNVIVNPIPAVPTISASGSTTICAGNSITLTSSAPAGNLWSTGATTQSITVNSSGSYLVQVILNGCTSGTSAPVAVTVNPLPPTPSITNGTTASFCSGTSMVLNSSASTGNLWSTTETTPSITITSAGSYTVQIVDGNGCTSLPSTPIVVSENPLPAAPTINTSGPTSFCYGDQVTLTSTYSTGNTWSNGSTANSVTVSMVGDYWVYHTDANGCVSPHSDTTHIVVNPIPAAPIVTANGPLNFCSGGNVTLTSSQPTGNYWSNAAMTQNVLITASGVYSVIYIDGNGCSSPSSSPVIVSVMANPPIPSITAGGPLAFCAGNSVMLTSSNTSGNSWNPGGASTQNINVTTSGSYTVTYTNANGCTSTSAPTVVTVTPVSAVPTITASGSTTICDGSSVTLTSSDPNSTWSTGATTQSIVVTVSGPITVVGNQTGCPSAPSAPVVITVTPAPPVPDVVPSGPTTICQGDELYLFTAASGSLMWSTGYTGQVLQVTTSGTYHVSVTNAYGCSAQSTPLSVVVNSLPTVTLTPLASMCKETTAPFVLSNGIPAGGTYTGTGVVSNIFYPAQVTGGATIVTYTYTDLNGCKGEAQQPVIVYSCLGIEENSIEFSLYPNPNDGRFTITSTGTPMDQIVIYDAQGKIVYDQTLSSASTVQFNLNDYSNGVYYIEIFNSEGLQARKPLVINH